MARFRTAQALLLVDAIGALIVVVPSTTVRARNGNFIQNGRIFDFIFDAILFLSFKITARFLVDSPSSTFHIAIETVNMDVLERISMRDPLMIF